MKNGSINKIYCIYYGRFPSEKAHAIFLNKSMNAFTDLGIEVEIVAPDRFVDVDTTTLPYSVTYIKTLNWANFIFLRKFFFWIGYIIFSIKTRICIKKTYDDKSFVYTNEYLPLIFLKSFKNVCLEIHDMPEKHLWFYGFCYRTPSHILFTNKWKMDKFKNLFITNKAIKFVELNAVDTQDFDLPLTKEEARKKINLPLDKKVVMYTGHLYSWKGVDTLLKAAERLQDMLFVFVGGLEKDVTNFKEKYTNISNILFVGNRLHKEIPVWQKAADVLVIPNTAREDISKYYTSPMKLFEYMLSGRSIVASDIPAINEIVDESMVNFFEPDSVESLTNCIGNVLKDDNQNLKTKAAYEKGVTMSWLSRARRIVGEISI